MKKVLVLILIFILLPAGVKAQYEELDSISENFSFSEATEKKDKLFSLYLSVGLLAGAAGGIMLF